LDLSVGAAGLEDVQHPLLKVHAVFDGAEHLVAGAEEAVEEAEFLLQQVVDTAIGEVVLGEEVDDDYVVLLTVAVAPADALLDSLGVPGQVVVDDERAELEV